MATRNSYADYLKTIPAGAVGANGLLGAPSTGVNYQAEGMTPQQYYDFMTQQVSDPMARDGADAGYRDRGPADASWIPGAQHTGAAGEFWSLLPLALTAGAYGGMGGFGGAGSGMTAAEADAALNAFDASQLGAAGVGGAATGAGVGTGAGSAAGGSSLLSTAGSGMTSAQADAALASFDASQAGGGALGAAGSFLKDNPTLAKLGGAALGAASAKDTQTTASQSKDPWSQAQPYLIDNLKTNAAMQDYYRANPFSNEQKTAYQGLLNTVANNAANSAPMMANANNFMQSSRGKMPAMQGLLTGTQAAPIDWKQYQNIGRK